MVVMVVVMVVVVVVVVVVVLLRYCCGIAVHEPYFTPPSPYPPGFPAPASALARAGYNTGYNTGRYESMKEVAAAREYATGLRAATSSLFAPGSPLALKIDCAMERSPKRAERDAHPVAWKERLVVLAHKAAFVESHAAFQGAITGCIIIAGVVIGLSTDRIGSMAALAGLDLFCLLVFTLEVFVKVAALGLEPLK